MEKGKSLEETKRKEKILGRRDKLRNSEIRKPYNKELSRLGKKQDEAEITDEELEIY